jgi:phage tail sheath protein FI
MSFFHGVETFNEATGTTPVNQVDTAVIGLVGIFPKGAVNQLVLCNSIQDTDQFGDIKYPMQGNESLRRIYKEDPGAKVLVVNVYNPATTSTLVTEEAITITNGKAQLDNVVLSEAGATVVAGGSPWATFTEGTDYTVSDLGVVTIIPSGAIAEGDTVYVTYYTFDISGLAAADFVGVTSPSRTGFKLFPEAYDTFGLAPKIFACPGYSALDSVANEMETQSDAFRARCVIDEEEADTRTELISNRTTAGKSSATTSTRVIPCGPWQKDYNYLDQLENYPYSMFLVGAMSANARNNGYWVSPSNKVLKGVVSPEYPMLGAGPNDATADVQLLNAAGITSVVKVGGSYRTYGNRSAAYPTSTAPENFIAIQWVDDIVSDSIENAMIQFIDAPLNQATIDAILGTANGFISTLIQRGALIIGSNVYYDPADNSALELAAGHVTFRRNYASPTPAERITFISSFDINLLAQLS